MTTPTRAQRGRANQRAGAAEQAACARLLALAGFTVWITSDPGAPKGRAGYRGTMVSPGIPDLFAIHDGASFALWWEAKAGTARLTPEQCDFADEVEWVPGLWFGWGDRMALRAALIAWNFLHDTADGVTISKVYPDVGRVVTRRRKP